jgi:hypothetical protein
MRCLSLLALVLAPACTWVHSRDDVLITSEPPGARIWVDGRDTGRTTPAKLTIAGVFGGDHEVELTRKGCRPARRTLVQHTVGYTSMWIDGAYDLAMPTLPFFWTIGDFFFPFGIRAAIVPGELHVRLYREDEPLLGFELLAAARQGEPAPRTAAAK